MQTIASGLLAELRKVGTPDADDGMIVTALIVAASRGLLVKNIGRLEDVFKELAEVIEPTSETDALCAVREWLIEPTCSNLALEVLRPATSGLSENLGASIDWDTELDEVLQSQSRRGPIVIPVPIARTLSAMVERPRNSSCTCLFGSAGTLAWCLASDGPVDLYSGDPDLARILALMAFGAGGALRVDRRNPVDGSFMPVHAEMSERPTHIGEADVVVTVPPLGLRVKDSLGAMISVETHQIERFAGSARKQFVTILSDGPLFRESKAEVEVRRKLASDGGIEIVSLPQGVFGRSTYLAGNLLRISKDTNDNCVYMIDARAMESQARGESQERLLVRHLRGWPEFRSIPGRSARVSIDEVASNDFILLPDRYLQSTTLQQVQRLAGELRQVALSEVVTVERGKAPRPLRATEEVPALRAWELTPSDISDGYVQEPTRRIAFAAEEAERARRVAVRPGDVVIGIKGSVGTVGLVPEEAPQPDTDAPWVISQSLAILRYRPNSHIPSAEMLAAILSAPWVREDLERLSTGSTVRTLSISDIKGLLIPVHSAAGTDLFQRSIELASKRRKAFQELANDLKRAQQRVWLDLWNIDPADAAQFFPD